MDQLEFKYHADSNMGLKRQNNEDAFSQVGTKFGNVFMVCDGMGGHVAGERASQIAVSIISEYLGNSNSQNFSDEIDQAIQHANKSIWEEASHDPSLKGMGTTCVVLYLTNKGEVYLGHVGDSRCYIYTDKNGLKTITKDHSYVQFLVEVGEISEEEVFDHPNKNRILKALGIAESVSPDVTKTPISPDKNTLFLLCSDGLNDMLRDKEIQGVLNSNESPKNQVDHLIEEALKKGGKDNVTVGILSIASNPFYTASNLKDETLIGQTIPPPEPIKKKSSKNVVYLLLLIALLVLSYFIFRPHNSNKTKKEEPTKEMDSTKEVVPTVLDTIPDADKGVNVEAPPTKKSNRVLKSDESHEVIEVSDKEDGVTEEPVEKVKDTTSIPVKETEITASKDTLKATPNSSADSISE